MTLTRQEALPLKKTKKSRLKRPKKQYSVDQCALYGLKGLGQLRDVLLWEGSQRKLEQLPYKRSSYRVWTEEGREIQSAEHELRFLHYRIATLLRRIKPPIYRHSGIRGRSYITNGAAHAIDEATLKLDISSYFTSTTFQHVYRFFRDHLSWSDDVAVVLAKICCFRDKHLPTGGVHSEDLAFHAHKPLFDKLNARAKRAGGVFTVYVDDLALSFSGASDSDLRWASRAISGHGLRMNHRKSRLLPKKAEKVMTGVKINGVHVSAPNRNHLKLREGFEALSIAPKELKPTAARRLQGRYDQIAQIDRRFKEAAGGNRKRLRPLLS